MGPPVFVVGCPRSGTTLLRKLLDGHPDLSSGPETHFLVKLMEIEQNWWSQLSLYGLTQEEWRSHVTDFFSWVHEQRALRNGKSRWIDKTPGYALILDFIDELYPDCQVIHIVRDPHDVIDSWRRRVGNLKGRHAVRAWPEHVQAARAFRDKHPADRYTEIRYEELVSTPKDVMSGVLSFLGEPWDERVIDPPDSGKAERKESDAMKRRRAKWLGITEAEAPPASTKVWAPEQRAKPSGISTSSVGVGMRGMNRLVNAPFFLELDLTCKDLVRELGYA
jgi:hypothetical protein